MTPTSQALSKEQRRAAARFGPPVPGTLGELVLFCTAAINPEDIDPATPYVGLEHLEPESGRWRWVPAGDATVRSPKGIFQAGDVLYGRLRPNLRKCCVATVDGVCSADIFVLRPLDAGLGPLLSLFLRSEGFAARAAEHATGASLPRVAARDLLATPLDLPPDPERTRLAQMAAAAEQARRLAGELERRIADVEATLADELSR
jgi:type I restriction enzyme S subunit